MAFNKKTWKDRVVQFPGRRKLVKEDSTEEIVTVQRYEGNTTQAGDAVTAANMNDLENRIASAFTSAEDLSSQLTAASGFSLTSKKFYRFGNVFMINCNIIPSARTEAGTRYELGSIPTEHAVFVWAPVLGSGGSHSGRVYVDDSNGKLMFDCAESVGANVNVMRMTMMWIKL